MSSRWTIMFAVACTMLWLSPAADAVPWSERAKLSASDAQGGSQFGTAVSVSGMATVVGAPFDDVSGMDDVGSAYVFEMVNGAWTQTAKLLASDGMTYDKFGCSVSLSGTMALIGAYGNDDLGGNSGSAYIFSKEGGIWTQRAKLLASDGTASDWFGYAVSITGSTALVGAREDKGSGSAYIFEDAGGLWTQTAKLLANDGAVYDKFGVCVCVSGTTALIGAEGNSDCGTTSGSAYVFERVSGAWTQTAKLLPSDGMAYDSFGHFVSLSGTTALVGAVRNSDCGSNSGSAYVFENVGGVWTQTANLLPADGSASDYFGVSVSLSGTTALVGATGNDDCGANSGSAYIFQKESAAWTQTAKLLASDGSAEDAFGYRVSISGTTVLVGAYGNDHPLGGCGSAYIFQALVPGDANGDWKIDGADLALWQRNYDPLGVNAENNTFAMGDFNGDGRIDRRDLALWQQNYDPLGVGGSSLGSPELLGTVPEPGSLILVATAALGAAGVIRRRDVLRRNAR